MATTEYEEPDPPSQAEQLRAILGTTVEKVTDTDASLPLRTWALLMIAGACVLFAPVPANVVGVLAVVALALSAGHRNRPR